MSYISYFVCLLLTISLEELKQLQISGKNLPIRKIALDLLDIPFHNKDLYALHFCPSWRYIC